MLQEFPREAQAGPLRRGIGCHLQGIRSATIEELLGGYAAIVAYSEDEPTIPADRRYRVATITIHRPSEDEQC